MSKKNELLINAAKIIYEEGIQQLTIDYIAKRSSMTKGGVLYHFKNKAHLLLQMNKLAIRTFEEKVAHFESELSGCAIYTRAYALATLHFFKYPEKTLLPAVFISSLEDDASFQLWKDTSQTWQSNMERDSGDAEEKRTLQLICDGIWFAILYGTDDALNDEIERLVLQKCKSLEKEK